MATEESPYEAEQEIEETISEELLALLALAIVQSSNKIVVSEFNNNTFDSLQSNFRSKASEVLPLLSSSSQESIQVGLERTQRELRLSGLSIDYSDVRFQNIISRIFEENIQRILDTNESMYRELRIIANERRWSSEEFARRLKKYYGLTPRHLKTVLTLESSLASEGISKRQIESRVQKRIDQLIEWRLNLIGVQIGTEIVEGSKEESFQYLIDTRQIDRDEYEKEWVSVVDDVTTTICLSSNRTRAEIGRPFPNGFMHPPANDPVHPCRSSIRIVKRIL